MPHSAGLPDEKKIPNLHLSSPIIIAGPCSAESEAQVMDTARGLVNEGLTWFRAGIWKPRTSPDAFAGLGEVALPWLKRVKDETGLIPAIEVANARHVELALEFGVGLVWIGARTTVSPFVVQEIADAVDGTGLTVMVKNPINPDVELWAGALERVRRANVTDVIICHRGFNVYGKSLLRNMPLWEIPIEIKRRFPDLKMICDPSHISGDREFIREVSQKALDLGFEGLMIETHIRPAEALSDAQQQITPAHFKEILSGLHFRRKTSDDAEYQNRMNFLRREIDDIDQRLIELLAERLDLAKKIGTIKKQNDVAFFQHIRWNDVVDHCTRVAEKLHLDPEFVLKVFTQIHLQSLDIQGE